MPSKVLVATRERYTPENYGGDTITFKLTVTKLKRIKERTHEPQGYTTQ
jgi:hypothetical protein